MSNYQLYLGGNIVDSSVRRDLELERYDTNYHATQLHLGYQKIVVRPDWLKRFTYGGYRLQLGYTYLGGDEGNLGSHKRQVDLQLGWKQMFHIPFRNDAPFRVFVDPAVGFGIARNRMNFGRGFPLEAEHSGMLQARLGLGAEYCFHTNLCIAARAGYFFEDSVAGLGYSHRGPYLGTELEGDLFGPKPEPCPEDRCWKDLARAKNDLTTCQVSLDSLHEEVAELVAEVNRLQADNQSLHQFLTQQIDKYKEKCGKPPVTPVEPGVLEPSWSRSSFTPADREDCREELADTLQQVQECRRTDEKSVRAELEKRKQSLAVDLREAEAINQKLIAQAGEVIQWVHGCCDKGKVIISRTPKTLLLFANDNPDLPLQPQTFFGTQPQGKVNPDLDDMIAFLNLPRNRRMRVRVHGYANDTGDAEKNLRLSEGRAKGVRDYLVKSRTDVGPTFAPIDVVPEAQRTNCIEGLTVEGTSAYYCATQVDASRVDSAQSHGSDPTDLEALRVSLEKDGIKLETTESNHPIFRLVWIELSDEQGRFKQ